LTAELGEEWTQRMKGPISLRVHAQSLPLSVSLVQETFSHVFPNMGRGRLNVSIGMFVFVIAILY
jgi:hypothetical protein